MPYEILIESLELSAHLGVPEEERALPQRLTVTLTLHLPGDPAALDDSISGTVDYWEVARAVQAEARSRPRRLLETLAEDLACAILDRFPVPAVSLTVRKYILPDAAAVAVQIHRARPPGV